MYKYYMVLELPYLGWQAALPGPPSLPTPAEPELAERGSLNNDVQRIQDRDRKIEIVKYANLGHNAKRGRGNPWPERHES